MTNLMKAGAALVAAGLCVGCEPASRRQAAAAPTAPAAPPSAQAAPEAAVLVPVAAEPSTIRIPRLAAPEAVAPRVNAVLDRRRAEAVEAARSCREIAEGRETAYALDAEVAYNANGLLSLRFTGDSFCGGANGTPLSGAETFDLTTGAVLDVVSLTGLERGRLKTLAAAGYEGDGDCGAFLRENLDADLIAVEGAYLTPAGIGVRYGFSVGAAEGCGLARAVIPLDVVRREGRLSPPLDRLE